MFIPWIKRSRPSICKSSALELDLDHEDHEDLYYYEDPHYHESRVRLTTNFKLLAYIGNISCLLKLTYLGCHFKG